MNHSTIICTKGRSKILSKTLKIYSEFNYKGEIIIGDDSSDEEFDNLHKQTLDLKDKLKIHHFKGPKRENPNRVIRNVHTLYEIFRYLKTDYVTSKGDDDFIFPNFVLRGIEFLEKNKEFSSFLAPEMKVFFKKDWTLVDSVVKPWRSNIFEDPLERCIDYANRPNLVWAGVCRSEAFKKIFTIKQKTHRDAFIKSNNKTFSFIDLEIPWCLAVHAQGSLFYDPSMISGTRGEFIGVDRFTNQGVNSINPASLAGTIYELQQKDSYIGLREFHEDLFHLIKQNNSKYKDDIIKNDIWVIIWRFFSFYRGRFLSKPLTKKRYNNQNFFFILYKKIKKLIINYISRDKFNLKKSQDYIKFINYLKNN